MNAPPKWFADAIAERPDHHHVEVAGCPIHYMSWGDQDNPGLLLVHGGAAHAQPVRRRPKRAGNPRAASASRSTGPAPTPTADDTDRVPAATDEVPCGLPEET